MSALELSRRELTAGLSGIVIAFAFAPNAGIAQPAATRLPGTLDANRRIDSWLRVDPTGTVTVYTGRVELGQGNTTALAQIAAEELDGAVDSLIAELARHSPLSLAMLTIRIGMGRRVKVKDVNRRMRQLHSERGGVFWQEGSPRPPGYEDAEFHALAKEALALERQSSISRKV